MKGRYYAVKKNSVTVEIQSLMDARKYGDVIFLTSHPVFECVIQVELLNDPNAIEMNSVEIKSLIDEDKGVTEIE